LDETEIKMACKKPGGGAEETTGGDESEESIKDLSFAIERYTDLRLRCKPGRIKIC
jgi:hypothetical protein